MEREGAIVRERKLDQGYRCGSHTRKRLLTDETRFKRFRKMDFCINCIFKLGITARFFCVTHCGR